MAAWLGRRHEPLDEGAFERLCGDHADLAAELRRLKRTLDQVAAALPRSESRDGVADRLAEQFGDEVDPRVSLDDAEEQAPGAAPNDPPPASTWSRMVERVRGRTAPSARYSVGEVLGKGGMGVVYSIWDADLRRRLAMKVIRHSGEREAPPPRLGATPSPAAVAAAHAPIDPVSLGRFLEEAQVTGQLNHPGIVPIHELGLDADGRAYFTMRLVKGATFTEVIDWAATGENGFNPTRALSVLVAVCDALAYAHAKGVVHRDLKPANVMVGRFGETYVMDWGLARVRGQADRHDLRLEAPETARLRTERDEPASSRDDSPLMTMDGAVVGTPAYMPPEQAFGKTELIDARADVYAVGAMLYHLLTRRMPYVEPGARMSQHMILAAVQHGPPRPVHQIDAAVPAELAAICERAMERDLAKRYPTTQALADDLRAYLEHRVVAAYETGAVAELKKWVERNKALAASLAAGVVLAIGAVSFIAWSTGQHADAMAEKNRDLTTANAMVRDEATRADAAKREAEANLADVLLLGDIKRVRDLEKRAKELWPAWPELVPELEQWIADAREVTDRLEQHRASLQELRAKALPADAPEDRSTFTALRREAQMERRRKDLAELDAFLARRVGELTAAESTGTDTRKKEALGAALAELAGQRAAVAAELRDEGSEATDHPARREWRFAPDPANTQWRHDQLVELVEAVEALQAELATPEAVTAAWRPTATAAAPPAAFVPAAATIAAMQRRIEHAAWVEEVSLDEAVDAWQEAIARIAKNPKYAAFAEPPLKEQFGLVPIGPDPDSGLEEFWHVETGARPERDPTSGKFTMAETTGMVFVLLPGGTFTMGSRPTDADHPEHAPHVDPKSQPNEQPPHAVTLAPFLMSKFEMSRAQWLRIAGSDPSRIDFNGRAPRPVTSPVESIDWTEAQELAERLVARLPTEAQWEYAARAGTTTVFWCGDDPATIRARKAGNVFDERAAEVGYVGTPERWNDGYYDVAPVGTFTANPFGLHDVIGNVWEWCADEYAPDYESTPARSGDGERSLPVQAGSRVRIARGGGWYHEAAGARSAYRYRVGPAIRNGDLGLRPAKVITW
ncbi:MAG: SUMF1/EgtB/PvdO family nonheme iron enzyme [Planctomycetes bacterium]|nr:SUMF1/EgtB/PvdO family nonheme iron enzyme [Planctomycetota bacterium]